MRVNFIKCYQFFSFLLEAKGSRPDSLYKFSLLQKRGNPHAILATSNCKCSSLLLSYSVQPSQTSLAYSKIGRIQVRYSLRMLLFDNIYLSFRRTFIFFEQESKTLFTWSDHLAFELNVTPRCLWLFDDIWVTVW